jgi:hypothetical protein
MLIYNIAHCTTAEESTNINSLKYLVPRLMSIIVAGKMKVSNLHKTFLDFLL